MLSSAGEVEAHDGPVGDADLECGPSEDGVSRPDADAVVQSSPLLLSLEGARDSRVGTSTATALRLFEERAWGSVEVVTMDTVRMARTVDDGSGSAGECEFRVTGDGLRAEVEAAEGVLDDGTEA